MSYFGTSMYMAIYFPIKMQQHLILKVADFIFQTPPAPSFFPLPQPKQKEKKEERTTSSFSI